MSQQVYVLRPTATGEEGKRDRSGDQFAPQTVWILEDEEIEALYGRPRFTADERIHYFTLTQPEQESIQIFLRVQSQLSFLLQLGYFKAKQRFFSFTLDEVEEDVQYILDYFFPQAKRATLKGVSKPTLLRQHDIILNLYQYRLCTAADRQQLAQRAQQAAKISSKPGYVFRELLQYLTEQHLVAPGYTVLQEMVGQALTAEAQRLTTIIQTQLAPLDYAALDRLFTDSQGLYPITRLKKAPRDFSLGEMRREIARAEELRLLYQLATRVIPALAISNEGVKYYASLVSYYSVFRLKQLDPWTVYLYLLCFVFHRYQQLHDNLLTCFLHLVKSYVDEAKAAAKEQIYEQRMTSNQDLPKAGLVLKLFTGDEIAPDTSFDFVQAKAFAILDRRRMARVADYIVTKATFDERAFQWAHIDSMARRFKQHLRPILRQVDLAANHTNVPILMAAQFLKTTFASLRSLLKVAPKAFPTRFIPVREKRYLYAQENTGTKQIRLDRYEFLAGAPLGALAHERDYLLQCPTFVAVVSPQRSTWRHEWRRAHSASLAHCLAAH
jgi:hypothetical protein